jgi:ABC-type dipeptide/oligopeptide/nickel transport system permease component
MIRILNLMVRTGRNFGYSMHSQNPVLLDIATNSRRSLNIILSRRIIDGRISTQFGNLVNRMVR